jgi:hypothetical protein
LLGEKIKLVVTFNYASAGYTQADNSPIGFYPQECEVKNVATGAPGTDVVPLVTDKCLRDDSVLDINTSSNLPANLLPNQPSFLKDAYFIIFDAFAFQSFSELQIKCTFEVCLVADCPDADRSC